MKKTFSVKGYRSAFKKSPKSKPAPALAEFSSRIDEITDPKNLVEFLYLNRNLTREEYEAKVLETAYRAALKNLSSLACSNDTKAIDLLFKRCDVHFSKHRQVKVQDDATPLPAMKPRGEPQ